MFIAVANGERVPMPGADNKSTGGTSTATSNNGGGGKLPKWSVAAVMLGTICVRQYLLMSPAKLQASMNHQIVDLLPCESSINKLSTADGHDASTPSSCTEYPSYPKPERHSGLPYLGDVFATRDKQYLFFIGMNRDRCNSEEFGVMDRFTHAESRFMCVYPGNTMVISEFVAPSGKIFRNNYMFKCKIPTEFQHLVVPGAETTELHVDLHAIFDPEGEKKGMYNQIFFESQKITDTPKIDHIPVCHAGHADQGDKRYNLVAYTRVKATYKTQVDQQGKTFIRSTTFRIPEWIEYHLTQGFDHFIIYDNDEEPHGPIEQILKPYVESGLVTHRRFLAEDCTVEGGKRAGKVIPLGQGASGLAAMHRMSETGAQYMAHMDVDEFFVIFDENQTVLDYVRQVMGPGSSPDVVAFRPTVLDFCRGISVESETSSPLETRQCWTKYHLSDVKLIMKMDTMLHFQVHYALATKSWQNPKILKVEDGMRGVGGIGFLAHLRGEITPGLKKTKNKQRVPYFDKFLSERKKEKKDMPDLLVSASAQTENDKSKVEDDNHNADGAEEEANDGDADGAEEEDNDGDADDAEKEDNDGDGDDAEEEDNDGDADSAEEETNDGDADDAEEEENDGDGDDAEE